MLAPDGRALLLDALRPPPGYDLGRAVATTFTLDLTAALVVPLAFARSQLGDSKDPVAVMEAVDSCAGRVDVFCQAGNMVVPRQAPPLVEFLGTMVHEVRRPRPGRLFHPKLWLLRFDSADVDPHFRLLVLSRNLTLDRGWDLVLRLDGIGIKRRNLSNDQLARLIAALPGMTTTAMPGQRADAIRELADQVRRVEWERPDEVNEIRMWAFGLGRTARPDFSGYRQLIVSPFITEGGLSVVRASALRRDLTVVARSEQLDLLDPSVYAGASMYTLDPLAGYGDVQDADPLTPDDAGERSPAIHVDSDSPPSLRDLHAKMYVIERDKRAHVFVGSANATDAAFGGNVEVLCELVGGHTKLGIAGILDSDKGMGALLQPYQPNRSQHDDETDALRRRLEEFLRSVAEVPLTARVIPDQELWRVELRSSRVLPTSTDPVELTLYPLNRPLERHPLDPGTAVALDLAPRPAADLTAFYVLIARLSAATLEPMSTVVRVDLLGAPESRLDEIVAQQIDTPEKFLRFLLLLLGAEPDPTDWSADANAAASRLGAWQVSASGVFELLATSLAGRVQTIDDLAGIVDRLQKTEQGRRILPVGWDDLWAAVTAARARLGNLT